MGEIFSSVYITNKHLSILLYNRTHHHDSFKWFQILFVF